MEKKFTEAVDQIQDLCLKSHRKAVEAASEIVQEALEHCKNLPHIEDQPPFTTDDRRYDWYYVWNQEDLAAVKLALYDPDATAFDKELPEYPTWIMAVTDDENYGDIEVTSQMNLAEIMGDYIGRLVIKMQRLTASLYENKN